MTKLDMFSAKFKKNLKRRKAKVIATSKAKIRAAKNASKKKTNRILNKARFE